MKKLFAAVAVITSLVGCADTHQLARLTNDSGERLNPKDSIYIAISRDGAYGDEAYPGSGLTTSQILMSSFARKAQRVDMAKGVESYDEAIQSAKTRGLKVCVIPTILQWEDRATEWSMIPDKVEVKVQIVEATTERVISSAIIKGKSGLATFGGDHPQDLLPKPIEQFVFSLY